jgi:hypothetical protein
MRHVARGRRRLAVHLVAIEMAGARARAARDRAVGVDRCMRFRLDENHSCPVVTEQDVAVFIDVRGFPDPNAPLAAPGGERCLWCASRGGLRNARTGQLIQN